MEVEGWRTLLLHGALGSLVLGAKTPALSPTQREGVPGNTPSQAYWSTSQ